MLFASTIVIVCFIGTLGAWRPDIDINRVRLLPKEESQHKYSSRIRNPHIRRSIFNHKNDDHDYYSSRVPELWPPMSFLPNALSTAEPKAVKIHQPREDPRLYYLSNAYAKEVSEKNLNNEVSAVYLEGDVVRANRNYYYRHNRPSRLRERETNNIPDDFNSYDICMKCPHDMTLVAKAGSDRVKLPYPTLRSCSGLSIPRNMRYEHMVGPKFGSLLVEGSYSIVGRIAYKGSILKHCVMEVHVLTQMCPLPKHLVAHCEDQNKTCNFKCRDHKAELHGPSNLTCGDDKKWIGHLPVCREKNWCELPPPPAHGRVSCKGSTMKGSGLSEGSTCRVRCARGWKWNTRPFSSCRHGTWTHELSCVLRKKLKTLSMIDLKFGPANTLQKF